jgi:glycosyltransferase involved in cell wall biosynthesis
VHVIYHHRTAGDRVEAVHIMGMVRALRSLGHTVDICSPPGCDPERKRPVEGGPAPVEGPVRRALKRFARHGPPLLFELFELAYNAWSLAAMGRLARRRRPDLIYERMTANSAAPTYLARRWRVPIVQEVNVSTEIGRLRPLLLRDLTQRLERWTVREAALLITVSAEFRRQLIEDGFPPDRTRVCHNAIEPAEFDPEAVQAAERPANVGPDALVLGYVGAFVPYHRLDMLVGAAHALADEFPRTRWLLVGDGVERPRIEALLADCGMAERFWLPGRVRHDRVPAHVKAMDVAVLPNSETFNSPMKLFEYMSMAKAVVAPGVPAVAEVVVDGRNGLLFEPGDAASFQAALRRVITDAALRERVGRAARQTVLNGHSWLHNAQRVLALLDEHRRGKGKVAAR